jgi:hypothetical protein
MMARAEQRPLPHEDHAHLDLGHVQPGPVPEIVVPHDIPGDRGIRAASSFSSPAGLFEAAGESSIS